MSAILLIFLTVVHGLAIWLGWSRHRHVSPLLVVVFVNFVRVVPFALLVIIDPAHLDPRVLQYVGSARLDALLTKYLLLESLGAILFFGLLYKADSTWQPSGRHLRLSTGVALLLLTIGTLLIIYRIAYAGGVMFLLEGLATRSQATAGVGFLSIPTYVLLAAAIAICAAKCGQKNTPLRRSLFIGLVVAAMILLALFGGRKNGLLILMTGVVAWIVYVGRIRIAVRAWAAILLVFIFYMNGVWLLRQPGGVEAALSDPTALVEGVLVMSLDVFSHLSYLETYLVSITYFDHTEYWYGAVFSSSPAALVPSLIYPDKPPLDEGMYFRSLLEGYHITPPVPARDLYQSSFPPETFGNGYAFFGPVGVLLFYAIKGVAFIGIWKAARRIAAPFSIVFLVYFAYGFEVSVYRVVQVAQVFFYCWVLSEMFKALVSKSGGRG